MEYIDKEEDIFSQVRELLYQYPIEESVRLLGISLSNLNNEMREKSPESIPKYIQLRLQFPDELQNG